MNSYDDDATRDADAQPILPWLDPVESDATPSPTVHEAELVQKQASFLNPATATKEQIKDALILLNRRPAFLKNGKEKFALDTAKIDVHSLKDDQIFFVPQKDKNASLSPSVWDSLNLIHSLIPEELKQKDRGWTYADRAAVVDAINKIAEGAIQNMGHETGSLLASKLHQIGQSSSQGRVA